MAALADRPEFEAIELSRLPSDGLDAVLAAEIAVWQDRLNWDFRPSADLLRRLLQIRSLYGCALTRFGEPVGYAYYVVEGRKGLIGNFFVRPEYASSASEVTLLREVVLGLMHTPGIRRIESQLMLLRTPPGAVPLPFSEFLSRHDRHFMQISEAGVRALPERTPSFPVRIVPWTERHLEDMAHLLAASYRGHVDSEINDQYRSIPGARQFLNNIVRFPGCGQFSGGASLVAVEPSTGRICGMCLTSNVSRHSGHITQVCILPALRASKIGYELIRQAGLLLLQQGSTSVSLTVTAANDSAVQLYRALGFQVLSTFPALVWEGF